MLHHRPEKLLKIPKPQRANGTLKHGAILARDVGDILRKLGDAIISPVSFAQSSIDTMF